MRIAKKFSGINAGAKVQLPVALFRALATFGVTTVLVAGNATAQSYIDEKDDPVAPIVPKSTQGPAQKVLQPPIKTGGQGSITVVTSSTAPPMSGEVALGAKKNGKTGPDLNAELPRAVESQRGVLRRPVAATGTQTAKVDLRYSNPVSPQVSSLPGLGYAPGSVEPGKPIVLRTKNGINEIVNVSGQFANRIVTSFERPKVLAPEDVEASVVGNSVYVSLGGQEPSAIYIIDKSGKSTAAISLTMVPQAIPPQTIIVDMEGVGKAATNDTTMNKEGSFEAGIRNLMRQIAVGTTPSGFTEETLDVGAAVSNGVRATPYKRYTGSENDIYRYTLENTSGGVVTLSEEAFGGKDVRSVAFFPKVTLAPGERTDVIILLGKEH